MPKFVFVYHAPMTPVEATPPSPEEMSAVMDLWNQWGQTVGDRLIDFGTPLANGVLVSGDGSTTPSGREVAGYTIIETDTSAEAIELAKIHPHLTMPGGCEIEVHEALDIPGM